MFTVVSKGKGQSFWLKEKKDAADDETRKEDW